MTSGDEVGAKGALAGRDVPPRPDLCRRYARKELAAHLPLILRCFIGEATKGSIPHAKALMSMAGLDKEGALPPRPPKKRKGGGGLSELLLETLRRPRLETAAKTHEPRDTGRCLPIKEETR